MAYADLVADAAYTSKVAGSALQILIFDEATPGAPIIGSATGINHTDDFETVPIEEAGNDGVDEIVQGRHTINFTVQGFWTPERNDALPTRQNFIGRKWTVMQMIAADRPGAGEVVEAITGCVLSRLGGSHGARGVKTFDLAFAGERRYNGIQWSEKAGG